MKRLVFIFFALVALLSALARPTHCAEVVRVGVYQNKPKIFVNEKGKAEGFYIDLLEFIAAKEGWRLRYVPGTWSRCLERLENGRIDLLPDIAYSDARAGRFDLSQKTVLSNWAVVYTPKVSGIESVADLNNKTIAFMRGDITIERFSSEIAPYGVAFSVIEADDYNAVFKLLAEKEADAGLVNHLFGLRHEQQYDIVRSPVICCPRELRFAVPKLKNQHLIQAIDRHLIVLRKDKQSVYYRALSRWIEGTVARRLPQWVLYSLLVCGGSAFLFLMIAVVSRFQVRAKTAQLSGKNKELHKEILERRQVEAALRVSEEKFFKAFRSSPDAMTLIALATGHIVEVNDNLLRITGYDRREILGRTTAELNLWGDPADRQRYVAMLQNTGRVRELVADFRTKAGDIRTCLVSGEVIDLQDGVYTIGIIRDITDKKRTEAALRESESRLREALDATQIGLWDWNMQRDAWYSTPRYFEMLGYNPTTGAHNRQEWGERIHPDDREFVVDKMTAVRDGGVKALDIEFRFRHADGSYRWINSIGNAVEFDEDGRATRMLGVQIDITQRKQTEEELRTLNAELSAVNRIITATTTVQGVEETLESVLDVVLSITGLEGGTICLMASDHTLQPVVHRAMSEAAIQDLSANVIKIGDCLCGDCAGDPKPIILPDREAVLAVAGKATAHKEGIRFHAAFPLLVTEKCLGVLCLFTRTDAKPTARSLKLIETVSSQVALAVETAQLYEKSLGYAAVLEDKIKERTGALEENQKALLNVLEDLNEKSEALEAANVRLQELDRLKNIFLASMSHELRTPLNSIIGFTGILLMGLSGNLNGEQEKQLGMVKNSAHHLLGLINDILDISKVEAGMMVPVPEEFSLNELIRETMESLSVTAAEKGVALVQAVSDEIALFSDRRRVAQILMNLLSNAVKFTEVGSIRLDVQWLADVQPSSIRIGVTDTGVGIRKEDMDRLFFPFQQVDAALTKKYEGTGLGLYLSKKLAILLGGDITVKSEYGRGSRFVLELPTGIDKKE